MSDDNGGNTNIGDPQGSALAGGDPGGKPAGMNGSNGSAWYSSFVEGLDQSQASEWEGVASRYKAPQEFAKGYLEMRKSAVFLPKEGSKTYEEDMQKVYRRLGAPDKPDAYQFNHLPDAPPLMDSEIEARENFRAVAAREGLTQKQVNALVNWNDSLRKVDREAYQSVAKQSVEKATRALKQDWGPDYEKNLNIYRTTLQNNAGDDFKAFATMRLDDGTFLGDHPAFVKLISKFGLERSDDDRDPGAYLDQNQRESTQAEIDKIENEALQKGLSPIHPNWPHAQLEPLYRRAHGSKPMGPGGTRVRR